jgi:arginyl-tRNA synthetase
MKSLLKKADEQGIEYKSFTKMSDKIDRDIIINLLNLRNVILKSYNVKSLNDITEYLYKITNLYNNLYANNRILTEEDKDIQSSRLLLTKVVYENNIKLLDILGITVPEKM